MKRKETKTRHAIKGGVRCKICNKALKSPKSLGGHMKKHKKQSILVLGEQVIAIPVVLRFSLKGEFLGVQGE